MRATRHPDARTAPGTSAPARQDVIIRPAPVAMVWQGPGVPHTAIAVPGVSLGDGDVLVAVELATICPSDAQAVLGGSGGVSVPLVLGHEQVGRIVAVGRDAVTSDGTRLVVGMRIVWSRRIGCGSCDACRGGVTSECRNPREYGVDRLRRGWELSGGFASHVLVRSGTAILTVPEIVPAAVLAPLACATALAAAAVEHITQAVDVDGETVAVWGADLVGLTVSAMLADEGAHAVVVEADVTRRSRALDFGAGGVAAGLPELARLVRAGGSGGVRRLARPVAVVGSAVAEAASAAAVASPSGASGSILGAIAVVVELRDAPTTDTSAATDALGVAGESGSGPWPTEASVARLQRTEPRHLTMAVDFASNAWFRYPFADLVAERFALERVDDALRSAASASSLRVALDPSVR